MEIYPSHKDLLDQVAIYYPKQFNEYNMDQAEVLGEGRDSYVFLLNGLVWKFTQNPQHAKVSAYLAKTYPTRTDYVRVLINVVNTYSVAFLPDLGLWCIVEQRLNKLKPEWKKLFEDYLEGVVESDPAVETAIHDIIEELTYLGIREWREDCVSVHNIMQDPDTGAVKVFDFGYTHSHFDVEYDSWA